MPENHNDRVCILCENLAEMGSALCKQCNSLPPAERAAALTAYLDAKKGHKRRDN